jgi:hypothetical protein
MSTSSELPVHKSRFHGEDSEAREDCKDAQRATVTFIARVNELRDGSMQLSIVGVICLA